MLKILSKIGPIYILFYIQLETLRNYLNKNLKKDFIRETNITVGFSILFVPKKDKKLRLCVDYRKLNAITIKNRIKKDDEWKIAFRTWYGTYEYQVMLFGLTNTSATCQTLINDTLAGYLDIYIVTYLNNILIYFGNLENYRRHIENVLEWLLIRQLRYKSEKCEFHRKEMNFLEFVIRINRIKIDLRKIQRIFNWPKLRNLKNL